jgi:hypothetical protein
MGCATAEAVSRWLPTAAARVRSCGICGRRSDTGAGFLRVLRFPLPIRIPPIAPHISSGAGTIGQRMAAVPKSHPMRIKNNNRVQEPVTVAEWSKALTVFARSDAGIMGSNPTQDMDV